MASVQISDLEEFLKLFYLGPIIESLNNQLEMVELFTKMTVDWSGRKVVIPVHVSRNTGTAYKPEAGTLPSAGKQGHIDLNIEAKYLYGRFSLTGPAIASAKTTANSFATYVQTEMEGLVTDTKIRANQAMWTGAGAVGFVHQRTAINAGAGVTPMAFTGNKDIVASLQALDTGAAATARLDVDVIRLDTYESAVYRPGGAADYLLVDGDALTPGNIQFQALNTAVLYTDGAGPVAPHNAAIAGNYSAMVVVRQSGQLAGGVFTPDPTVGGVLAPCKQLVESEALGVYANLGFTSHFGNDRSVASNASIRSTVQCIDPAVAANSTLNFKRLQGILDEIMVLGGDDPDCLYAHPSLRQEYSALLSFVGAGATSFSKDVQGTPGKGDPGFSGYAFNGIPMKMSRHCGKGILVFLNTKVWSIAELKSFGMADLDGNVLSRVSNADEWEGFVAWYYNLVCKEPNRCAILTGITFPGQ